eukprot:CAMPEP_0116897774 /NCGR_PEP_ID=MMETSP0467-20121206/6661_1 /TAXON_ID=283647 /ORGANISM="Mesodinium pulex, Strain SPMC105" /LENGTH=33 /DNA_ID= /DNA_START= /DNA_END= /DNA_ORIENTATION=
MRKLKEQEITLHVKNTKIPLITEQDKDKDKDNN